jgi:hypothetical protein
MAGSSVPSPSPAPRAPNWSARPVAARFGIARTLAFVAVLAPASGCAQTHPIEGPVRLSQMAAVNGPRVRADRVVEDSRCPVGVQCVQAGRLVVRATVFGGGWAKQVDLALGVPVIIADGMLTLVDATSRRQNSGPRPYRFTFNFQGGL